ncbi:MAG: asparaginase [Terracoccus sp.]
MSQEVTVLGRVGPDGPGVFVLYTGGTIGMVVGPEGGLVPLDLREVAAHVPVVQELPVGLTVATVAEPVDSATMGVTDWLRIADAIVEHAPGHLGVVVLHGTDTMAYTASALSFLLEGIDVPVVLTGSQRPITAVRSDGRENLVTSLELASARAHGGPVVPEVTVFFDHLLLRGNRTVKVSADSYHGFDSPNLPPLVTAGVTFSPALGLARPPQAGPVRRASGLCSDVAAIHLYPGLDRYVLDAVVARPGLRGLVLQAYGAGNGPSEPWFAEAIARAVESEVTVVVTTQCRAGWVRGGLYAAGAAMFDAGAVAAGDMTFEAALTKLMVALDRHDHPDEVRRLMMSDLAGELTT